MHKHDPVLSFSEGVKDQLLFLSKPVANVWQLVFALWTQSKV